MKKTALTVHEKAVQRIQQQADQHLDKFRKMEVDLAESIDELNGVINAIDVEVDKLSALRIKTYKQVQEHTKVKENIGNLLGKGK